LNARLRLTKTVSHDRNC